MDLFLPLQLHALVDLMGPIGIEIIDADILAYIKEHLGDIKSILESNAQVRQSYSEKGLSSVRDVQRMRTGCELRDGCVALTCLGAGGVQIHVSDHLPHA